jgi:hypothetical protein
MFDFSNCPGYCETIRHNMVLQNHPILSHMHDEPKPSFIPIPEALAMALEEKENLQARLLVLHSNIKSLRDCAEVRT